MPTIAVLRWRCRRCGVTIDCGTYPAAQAPQCVFENVQVTPVHNCRDPGIGIMDCIGADLRDDPE